MSVGVSQPVKPGSGEVRLDVAYCGICGTDLHIFHGHMHQRVKIPQVIGHDVSATVAELGKGVTGFSPGVQLMTELPNVRGRIVMVAIHPQPQPVNLFKFFWSELRLIGARLYEEQDFDEAIRLATARKLHLDRLITRINPIDAVQERFEVIGNNPSGIKYLIQCR